MKNYKNYLDLHSRAEGNERRYELMNDVLNNGSFLPKTVTYEDIDKAVKDWVSDDLEVIGEDGKKFPTMSLYSNQRFSEYSQTWEYTDVNKNLILNFKTVTRENNPKYGTIRGNINNVPGDRYYLIKRKIVLDDNGSESFLDLKMKLPTSVDLIYKITIFTTKYQLLNTFNSLINRKFAAKQCYIHPNGHYMAMVLDSINDESQYNIDDRQFYSQTFNIKVMGYIVEKDDYRTDEIPLKLKGTFSNFKIKRGNVEIEELDDDGENVRLSITFPPYVNTAKFTIDCRFIQKNIALDNILKNYTISVNSEKTDILNIYDGDVVKIKINKLRSSEISSIIIDGLCPKSNKDYKEYNIEGENE